MIVGRGGDGFGIVARAATKRFAVALAGPRQKFRTVTVEDLAHDIVDLVDLEAAAGLPSPGRCPDARQAGCLR